MYEDYNQLINNIENDEEKNNEAKEKREEIIEFGTANGNAPDESIQILPIIGQIEGQCYLLKQNQLNMNM